MSQLPESPTQNAFSLHWIGIGFFLLLIGNWVVSQYLAYSLGYPVEFDPYVFSYGSTYVYYPFQWLVWVYIYFGKLSIQSYLAWGLVAGTSWSFICVLFTFGMQYRSRLKNQSSIEGLHGSAHFATDEEVKKTGLLDGKGVYVGAYVNSQGKHQYLRHNGPEHILAFAPTRSGKGVGLVLPTLLSWRGSVLVHDIKGENYAVTAGWRKAIGQRILKFAPSEENSIRFNPLQEIRIRTKDEVKDTQNIATMIVDPEGKGLNDHWAKTGFALLVGAILHQLYVGKDKTLRGVANMLSDPSVESVDQIFEKWLNEEHDPEGKMGWKDPTTMRPTKTHPVVSANAREMLNKADNEKSGVISTSMSFLSLYRDNMVARNTEVSDFKIEDLMNFDEPCSLFLVVPPSDKDRLKPLIRLVVNQVVRTLTEKMEFKGGTSVAHYKHRLLLLIDEFPALGKLDIFAEALAFIAGYGLKAYLITQDLSQLYAAYTKDESIVSNCHIRIAYAPNKIETAELLSKMTGKATIKNVSNSYSGNVAGVYLGNVSSSVQEVGRELMTPDEVLSMPPSDSLIFVAGFPVIKGKKIIYYKDKVFSERSKFSTDVLDSRNQLLLDRLRNENGDFVSKDILTFVDEGKINLWENFVEIQRKIDNKEPIVFNKVISESLDYDDKPDPSGVVTSIPITKSARDEPDKNTWQALAKRRQNLKSRHSDDSDSNNNNNTGNGAVESPQARREATKRKIQEIAASIPEQLAEVDENGNEYETPAEIFEQNSHFSNESGELESLLGFNNDDIDDAFFGGSNKEHKKSKKEKEKVTAVDHTYDSINKLRPVSSLPDRAMINDGFSDFDNDNDNIASFVSKQMEDLSMESISTEEAYFDPDEGELESNIKPATSFNDIQEQGFTEEAYIQSETLVQGFEDVKDGNKVVVVQAEEENKDNDSSGETITEAMNKVLTASEENDDDKKSSKNKKDEGSDNSEEEYKSSESAVGNLKVKTDIGLPVELPTFKKPVQPVILKEEPVYFQEPLLDQESDDYNPNDYLAIARGDYDIPDVPTMKSAPSVGFGSVRSSVARTEHMKMKRYYSNNANLVKKLM
jgi:type IV secretion system protein VirD4